MTKYLLFTFKNDHIDKKNSKSFDTKEDLQNEYDKLKEKYHASETSVATDMMNMHGLFKFAKGECKHGKAVSVEYAEVEGTFTCGMQ